MTYKLHFIHDDEEQNYPVVVSYASDFAPNIFAMVPPMNSTVVAKDDASGKQLVGIVSDVSRIYTTQNGVRIEVYVKGTITTILSEAEGT